MIPKSCLKNKSLSRFAESNGSVSNAGLLEFLHMAAEGCAVLCSRLLPFAVVSPFSPVSQVPRASLICIRIRATAYTPNLTAESLTVAVHEANAEVHEPRVRAILGTRGRRPITSRLDIVKGMA